MATAPPTPVNARRNVVIPAINGQEEIHSIEEYPPSNFSAGYVRVTVRTVDANGLIIPGTQFKQYTIKDADYQVLVGPASANFPGKPTGTYSNDNLWFFIDQQRANGAV